MKKKMRKKLHDFCVGYMNFFGEEFVTVFIVCLFIWLFLIAFTIYFHGHEDTKRLILASNIFVPVICAPLLSGRLIAKAYLSYYEKQKEKRKRKKMPEEKKTCKERLHNLCSKYLSEKGEIDFFFVISLIAEFIIGVKTENILYMGMFLILWYGFYGLTCLIAEIYVIVYKNLYQEKQKAKHDHQTMQQSAESMMPNKKDLPEISHTVSWRYPNIIDQIVMIDSLFCAGYICQGISFDRWKNIYRSEVVDVLQENDHLSKDEQDKIRKMLKKIKKSMANKKEQDTKEKSEISITALENILQMDMPQDDFVKSESKN